MKLRIRDYDAESVQRFYVETPIFNEDKTESGEYEVIAEFPISEDPGLEQEEAAASAWTQAVLFTEARNLLRDLRVLIQRADTVETSASLAEPTLEDDIGRLSHACSNAEKTIIRATGQRGETDEQPHDINQGE